MKIFVAISVLVLAVVVYQTNGLCNTCAITGIACVAENQYRFCDEGEMIGNITTCPENMSCTTSGPSACARSTTVQPSCARCKTCDNNKVFACTKYNAFSLCSGTTTVNENIEYICPPNYVCNVDSPEICVEETDVGGTCPLESVGTTSTTTTTTTTTARPDAQTQPNAFCASIEQSGNHEIPTDATCKYFINCKSDGTSWTGSLWVCPKDRYFNNNIGTCGTVKPDRCLPPV